MFTVIASPSEAIQGTSQGLDCFVASLLAITRGALPLDRHSRAREARTGNDGVCVDTPRHAFTISRHHASELLQKHPPIKIRGRGGDPQVRARRDPKEGAGNAGCSWHPQPVCESSVHTVVTTGTPETPGIPCAMVFTAYAALSRATNSSC